METQFVRPRTQIEETLADIWAEVLELDQIGINDDFLDLGGDSLQAATLMVRLEETFGKKLPLAHLIDSSTIGEMAQIIRIDRSPSHASSLVEIQPLGEKPPFFCVHQDL